MINIYTAAFNPLKPDFDKARGMIFSTELTDAYIDKSRRFKKKSNDDYLSEMKRDFAQEGEILEYKHVGTEKKFKNALVKSTYYILFKSGVKKYIEFNMFSGNLKNSYYDLMKIKYVGEDGN